MTNTTDATYSHRLSDADFERFRVFMYRRTGIQFADNKRYFVDKRVADCIAASGNTSFAGWFAHLRLGTDADLLQQMVNRLTVNETYFLREEYQFDALVHSVLPQVLAERRGSAPVRILSIPCSTGEEAYSIAIELLERWPDIRTVDVEITAADIDSRALDAARAGVYGARSVQRVPAQLLERYFSTHHGGHQISSDLRDAIDFRIANICDTASMRSFRRYDVIYCRNLLIYFDELSSRQAAEHLFGALRPGGFLFLGHSESMSRISPIFTPIRVPEGIVYQRPKAVTP